MFVTLLDICDCDVNGFKCVITVHFFFTAQRSQRTREREKKMIEFQNEKLGKLI